MAGAIVSFDGLSRENWNEASDGLYTQEALDFLENLTLYNI